MRRRRKIRSHAVCFSEKHLRVKAIKNKTEQNKISQQPGTVKNERKKKQRNLRPFFPSYARFIPKDLAIKTAPCSVLYPLDVPKKLECQGKLLSQLASYHRNGWKEKELTFSHFFFLVLAASSLAQRVLTGMLRF